MNVLKSIFVWLTGILFLVVFFPVTFAIWLIVLPFDRQRAVIHRLLVWQSMLLVKIIPVLKLKIEGKENYKKAATCIIISNHQSLIDILVLNCLGYRFKWISKIENTKVPVLGWYLRMAGYITVDRNDDESKAEMLARSYKCLKDGTSIMIFPEGTRINSGIGYFKRGAFQLALETGLPILPVILDGTREILPKHGYILKGFHDIRLKVLEPIKTEAFPTTDVEKLAEFFREKYIAELNELRSGKR
jgi:1-acyl-sn-glycerol-3-phosphate acyltransferase